MKNNNSIKKFLRNHNGDENDNWTKSIGELGYEANHDVYCKKISQSKGEKNNG